MTNFWKPINPAADRKIENGQYKFLGRGAYTLWCRCDLCFRSGPSTEFHFLIRDEAHGELCDDCYTNRRILMELWADGWKSR